MNKIIALVGRSAVGKTTLEKLLEKEHGFAPLISHTSRPRRDGEIEGNEYYFTDNDTILKMIEDDMVLEDVSYIVNGEEWRYALARTEVAAKTKKNKNTIVTVNPHGIKQLMEQPDVASQMIIVYMVADDNLQFRYYQRESESLDTAKKWKQRKYQDDLDFTMFEEIIIPELQEMNIPIIKYDNTLNDKPEMNEEDVLRFLEVLEAYNKDCKENYFKLNSKYFDYWLKTKNVL